MRYSNAPGCLARSDRQILEGWLVDGLVQERALPPAQMRHILSRRKENIYRQDSKLTAGSNKAFTTQSQIEN
jgi:hypothetical protein